MFIKCVRFRRLISIWDRERENVFFCNMILRDETKRERGNNLIEREREVEPKDLLSS